MDLLPPFGYLKQMMDQVKYDSNLEDSAINENSDYNVAESSDYIVSVPGEIRTPDFLFRRQVLYPLSYRYINLCST